MCIKALYLLMQRATHGDTWCNARQRARNATQSNVTAVVVCCLQIKQVPTTDLPIWERVERNLYSVKVDSLKED